jgi:hypothetical protein
MREDEATIDQIGIRSGPSLRHIACFETHMAETLRLRCGVRCPELLLIEIDSGDMAFGTHLPCQGEGHIAAAAAGIDDLRPVSGPARSNNFSVVGASTRASTESRARPVSPPLIG